MDNKNISTKLGVAIIIIFSLTALAFVLLCERSKSTGVIQSDIDPIIQKPQMEKKQDIESKKIETNSPSGKYTSIDNVIEFRYAASKDRPIYEKDGIIQYLWQINDDWSASVGMEGYEPMNIAEKKYAIVPFLEKSQEGIMIFDKKESETLEDAIKRLIRQQGKNPSNCKIVKEQDGEKEKARIELASEYKPTEKELRDIGLPEGIAQSVKESFAIGAKKRELCSMFCNAGGPGVSVFEYDSKKNKSKFIFEQASGYDSSINFHTVEFLSQK
ncbi:MAG: hypothetical protein WC823_06440 [Parcubacteria group bacterium]|jgi:hypothetical protein